MFSAALLVERGNHRAPSENWGEFVFLSSPSPGDRVAVMREREQHYLTVLSVHHRPVANGAANDPGSGPSAEVVARWTGSEIIQDES